MTPEPFPRRKGKGSPVLVEKQFAQCPSTSFYICFTCPERLGELGHPGDLRFGHKRNPRSPELDTGELSFLSRFDRDEYRTPPSGM